MHRRIPSTIRRTTLALALLLACAPFVAQAGPVARSAGAAAEAAMDAPLPKASEDVRRLARWITASHDNGGLPFLLVDKVNAHAFAFDARGRLQGDAPVLLGMARGDRLLAPNSATMAVMSPQVRITPAGRFLSRLARDSDGKELLVLDYDAAISLHPVITTKPEERRIERIQSETVQDNRISYGCINVPAEFYSSVVSPTFTRQGVVYVLPESGSAAELFGIQPAGTAEPETRPVNHGARAAP